MSTYVFGNKKVCTRKEHECFGCGRVFPAKTIMERQATHDEDNKIYSLYLCPTCSEIVSAMNDEEEFIQGELLERAEYIEQEKVRE